MKTITINNDTPYISINWIKKHILGIPSREEELKARRELRLKKINYLNAKSK